MTIQLKVTVEPRINEGTREIGSLYRGSVTLHLKRPGWKISLIIPRTSLYRGSLNRGSTVLSRTFLMPYKVVLTFESVDEIIKCDHSNESY